VKWSTVLLAALAPLATAHAVDDPRRNRAYNDHIAYVVSFMTPALASRCAAVLPEAADTLAQRYLDFMGAQQVQIERGRLLTLAEFPPEQTLQAYRNDLIAARTGQFDAAPAEARLRTCRGVAGVLGGDLLPGEWPGRD
jgi:hypothetical protein